MRKITFLFLLFVKVALAQDLNNKIIYLDSLNHLTTKENHYLYRVVKDYNLNLPEYQITQFFKSGKIESEGISTDKDFLKPKGIVTTYYENGNKKSEINYENQKPIGNYICWYLNGKKREEGVYLYTEDKNEQNQQILQYWNGDGIQKVIDGSGEYEEIEKTIYGKGILKNGLKQGIWKGYSISFNFDYSEEYIDGKLIGGTSIDSKKIEHQYTKLFSPPKPNKGFDHFYQFIGKKFRIPRSAENINGRIILSFVIDKDATVKDIKVEKSLSKELDDEAVRLVEQYDQWGPGEYRGIKIRTSYAIPITIQESN